MLTENEKKLLGIMVDLGQLRGHERESAGGSDEIARELIGIFKADIKETLPQQIEQLTSQAQRIQAEANRLSEILVLVENNS